MRKYWVAAAFVALTPACGVAVDAEQQQGLAGLTTVEGIKVGHVTLTERPTGCTVILVEAGAVGGVDVRGGAPGTRETDLLDPANTQVTEVHAVVLSGGSAFGLDAASGVVRYLEERDIGYAVGSVRVPIVVGAVLFDLLVGSDPSIRPDAECGYRAASLANTDPVAEGSVGAGAGATVGKIRGMGRAMKGGIGTASLRRADGLTVAALVAVNAVGDIVDPSSGTVIAGVRTADGDNLASARDLILSGFVGELESGSNTTLGVIATNAQLTPAEATKIAQMAHDGLARAIYPSHTPPDGDTIFALGTGTHTGEADLFTIGTLAAEVIARAVVRAAREASGLPGLPAASELPAINR